MENTSKPKFNINYNPKRKSSSKYSKYRPANIEITKKIKNAFAGPKTTTNL